MWKGCVFGVSLLLAHGGAATAKVLISVDVLAQEMTVTVDGEQRYTWPVSTGAAGYTTPPGKFPALRLEADHYSREWDNAPMPHSIFFTEWGHAIHGTTSSRSLGAPGSHGCVRLSLDNAALLFSLVEEEGLENTEVDIISAAWQTEPYEAFGVIGDRPPASFDSIIKVLDGR